MTSFFFFHVTSLGHDFTELVLSAYAYAMKRIFKVFINKSHIINTDYNPRT
jgi:hypothetical protein